MASRRNAWPVVGDSMDLLPDGFRLPGSQTTSASASSVTYSNMSQAFERHAKISLYMPATLDV